MFSSMAQLIERCAWVLGSGLSIFRLTINATKKKDYYTTGMSLLARKQSLFSFLI